MYQPGQPEKRSWKPILKVVPVEKNSKVITNGVMNANNNGNGRVFRKKETIAKKKIDFVADDAMDSSPFVVIVENLEQKRFPQEEFKKMTPSQVAEERKKRDYESVLYYFQCVLNCGVGMKFTSSIVSSVCSTCRHRECGLERIPCIPPLKLTFEKQADAQKVLEAWNRAINRSKKI